MCRAGFMAHQDVANAFVSKQFVVNGEDGATGIAEYKFDPLIDQAIYQDFGAAAFARHFCFLPSAQELSRISGSVGP
jgi:hypothetical protein